LTLFIPSLGHIYLALTENFLGTSNEIRTPNKVLPHQPIIFLVLWLAGDIMKGVKLTIKVSRDLLENVSFF
jgi:hypothetical protein